MKAQGCMCVPNCDAVLTPVMHAPIIPNPGGTRPCTESCGAGWACATAAAHRDDGCDALLVDVPRLLEERLPDEEVGQSAPEVPSLIREGAEARAQDGLDAQALHLGRVLGHLEAEEHRARRGMGRAASCGRWARVMGP